MILLSYILLGHPDWKGAVIKIFSVQPEKELEEAKDNLHQLIKTGRLPVSAQNIELIPQDGGTDRRSTLAERSSEADLVIVGFRGEALRRQKMELFSGYDGVGNVLFVNTRKEIGLLREDDTTPESVAEDQSADAEPPPEPAKPDEPK
jgi:hypothetical protein